MAGAAARAALEALLRERKLDSTLTSTLPPVWQDAEHLVPTGLPPLDELLSGGVPRGQVSEIVGPRSSGRTSLVRALMADATRRGELVALIDTFDRFDPSSAAAAGIDGSRLLWVRGVDVPLSRTAVAPDWEPSRAYPGRGRQTLASRALDRAIKALNLVLQSGGFGLVVIDLADVPLEAIRELPFNTWMRLHRVVEGGDTACVLLGDAPTARSAGGVSIRLQPHREPSVPGRARDEGRPAVAPRVHAARADKAEPPVDAAIPWPPEEEPEEQPTTRAVPGSRAARPGRSAGPRHADTFHEAVLASRRPFLRRPAGGGITGRWSGEGSRLGRFRGLSSSASVVRAQRREATLKQVAIEFPELPR